MPKYVINPNHPLNQGKSTIVIEGKVFKLFPPTESKEVEHDGRLLERLQGSTKAKPKKEKELVEESDSIQVTVTDDQEIIEED